MSDTIGPEEQFADLLSLQALRLCHAGRVREGVALYRRALRAPGAHQVPVRRHVQLLAGTGLSDAATRIQRAGLRADFDLSSRCLDPHEAVADYEDLFARGLANGRMMENYLVCLSRIGASEKLAAATDPDVLFRQTTLAMSEPLEPFLGRVADALLRAESREFQVAHRSIHNMERVRETHRIDDADVVALHSIVRDQIAAYIADVTASRHMIAGCLPARFHLDSWGVIAAGGGHSAPHIHTGCWVVAVAYIAGEDPRAAGDGMAGTMRIGPAVAGDATCGGWPQFTVAPIPGTVVIMPAYYTHWTVPLQRSGLRISLVFNAVEAVHREPACP